jgi:hypothetical protein
MPSESSNSGHLKDSPSAELQRQPAGAVTAGADPLQALLDLALEPGSPYSACIGSFARDLLTQLDPQDSAEKMLVTQMIATFSRSMFLSRHANRQKNPKWFALYSAECDRTMHLYRKQMQSLADYRRPQRRTFTAIRTANIAGQQVVVSGSARAGRLDRKDVRVGAVGTVGAATKIEGEDRLLRARL